MELSHQSHHHPLFFVDGESETDELVRCFGCGKDICGGRYSCNPCQFHLHKSCTELPPRLEDHPFHPQHPLALLSYHYKGSYAYDACDDFGDGFGYRCDLCDFDLHTMCALSFVQKGIIFSERIGDQHLLMLKEEEQSDDNDYCFVCSESISAPFFSCSKSRCTFRLHKSCADLPLSLHNNSFHPQHPIFLISPRKRECQICGQASDSSAYYYVCKPCDFSIHPRCALSDPIDNIKRVGHKQIQYFTHQHLLTLLQDEGDEGKLEGKRDDTPCCHLCKEEVASFPSYGCQLCPFFLHKSCAELPAQIKTHLHLHHFLFLFARPPPAPPAGITMSDCDCCGTDISYSNYRCVQCGFMLHVDCFLSQPGSEKLYGHKHCFSKLQTFQKLTCQICGEGCHFSSWQCSSCHIIGHRKCVDLPRILKLEPHHHNLKLTYYLSSLHGCEGMTCRLCYRKINVDYATYYCSECNYGAHVECAPQVGSVISDEENQDDQHSSKESQNITSSLVEGNKSGIIQHFSHQQHELTLMEQELEDHKYCEGCVRLIFPPFYSCKQCNFYLHKKCGDSPRIKKHPFHDHLLTLEVVDEPNTWCRECGIRFNGFMYRCQTTKCTFRLDLECADTFSEGLQHPCHEHPLFFPYTRREYETCRGCCMMQKHVLVCSKCDDYALGYDCGCLRIPQVAKHRYDDHLLKLSYQTEDESGEYYCDICEEKRDPQTWFYSCSQCDFSAHIDCTLGEFPHYKHGTSWKFPSHEHQFTLVEKSKRNPPSLCQSCGKHCYSKLLECCECNLHFHFSLSCLQQAHPKCWDYL